jgi:hypothetical protein
VTSDHPVIDVHAMFAFLLLSDFESFLHWVMESRLTSKMDVVMVVSVELTSIGFF